MTQAGIPPDRRIELWGGIECTVNRVGNRYFDQIEMSGHASRIDDIDRIAALGIRTVRYPLLWERTAPSSPQEASWAWSDERMKRLSKHGITPIVGLLHHGSGPRHTSLLDDRFADKLTDYADAVAKRYGEIRYVTPVNEPLTTARFSTLYGHWYPHRKSAADFARAIVNQCVAIRDATEAMRSRIPDLQLVQTEDVGRVASTPRLSYQAEYENHRRWLTFDLLCGRVGREHAMWNHLATSELAESQLDSLVREPCSPDIIGVNYYVTSDRFIDHRVDDYPVSVVGGNGRERYADVEAVRALDEGIAGHESILTEAWSRYCLPVAITEVHLGCTREHQLRWLNEAWQGAHAAKKAGCDIRAVTAWALFGSHGWDSLVTREPFVYESGAFDIRSPEPRATALATAIREITLTGTSHQSLARGPGWWRRESRLAFNTTIAPPPNPSPYHFGSSNPPILVTGAAGTLGAAFVRVCRDRGLNVHGAVRNDVDITSARSIHRAIERLQPWAIINAAGFVRVDDAETMRASCYSANSVGVANLSSECARAGIPLVTYSSDLVFDGKKREPYVESDKPLPLGTYGASKLAAENHIVKNCQQLVIRTSAFFGPWDEFNFAENVLRSVSNGIPFVAASDNIVSPTYVPDLVNASLDLLIDGETGIWHLANLGAVSWSEFALRITERMGLSEELVQPVAARDLDLAAERPAYAALGSERSQLLPSLDDALDRWIAARTSHTLTSATALQG